MDFKEIVECAKNVVEATAIFGGVAWFLFRVVYQKTYQRLTAEVAIKPVGPEIDRAYEVECKITNKSPVRINLQELRFEITGTCASTGVCLKQNLTKFAYNRRKSNSDYWSVDAESAERFIGRFSMIVPEGAKETDATVEVMFIPEMTGSETYTVKQSFRISGASKTTS